MRVAIYIGQLDVGGAEGQVVSLAGGLLARRHEVLLLAEEGRAAALPRGLYAHFAMVPRRPRRARLRALGAALAAFRPDVLHCQLTSANLWGTLAAPRAGVGAVVISFLSTDQWKRWYHLALDRWLARRAAGIMVNSRGVAERYRPVLRGAAAKVHLIYNGVDTKRFARARFAAAAAAIRTDELHVPAAAPVIINVANFSPVKNHTLLLRAVAAAARGREAKRRPYLVLLGDGPEKENITREAGRLGLLPFVRILGRLEEVERYLAAADIFVLSSDAEGFSNALLEAMASSLACVATDVGGNAEALAGGAGAIVPPGDGDALAGAISELLDNDGPREALAAAARRRAVDEFGLERMVAETERWYREVVGTH